jgi:endonuclease/exonuclease/phosphatase family metal-dependent hydrolase
VKRPSVRWRAALAAVAATVIAASAPAAAAAAPTGPQTPPSVVVGVQVYNMYFGADLQPLFAPGANPVVAASAIWAEMQASKIPERATAVARQIVAEQPDLVGLNEVSTWRSAPATFDGTTFAPAGLFATDYDALNLLLADLAALGTPYTFVTANTNFSNVTFPLPILTASGFRLATFTDRDVILVKSSALSAGGLALGATQNHTYATSLVVNVAGSPVAVPRGWSAVDVTASGWAFRFANTHFEAYTANATMYPLKDDIRNAQAEEIAAALKGSPLPVILVGDVNVRPTMCKNTRKGTSLYEGDQNIVAYHTLNKANLREVWPLVYPTDKCGSSGWTSGQELTDAVSTLDHRIDDVFVSTRFKALDAIVVGDEQADRTPSGLWPSDHASTVAWVSLGNVNQG